VVRAIRPKTASSSSLTALLLAPFSLLGSFLHSVPTESIAFLFILNDAPPAHGASSGTAGEKEHFAASPSVASRVVRLRRMMSLELNGGICLMMLVSRHCAEQPTEPKWDERAGEAHLFSLLLLMLPPAELDRFH
jgi:hypothetical protein